MNTTDIKTKNNELDINIDGTISEATMVIRAGGKQGFDTLQCRKSKVNKELVKQGLASTDRQVVAYASELATGYDALIRDWVVENYGDQLEAGKSVLVSEANGYLRFELTDKNIRFWLKYTKAENGLKLTLKTTEYETFKVRHGGGRGGRNSKSVAMLELEEDSTELVEVE